MLNTYLELKNINKTYRSFALKDIEISFKGGRWYYLDGENGAGKTTLLNIIVNFIFPDSGEILYFGKQLKGNESWIKNRMAFIPNYVGLPSHVTPRFLSKMYKDMYKRFDMKSFEKYIYEFNIDNMDQKLGQMSDGMKKKVLIALEMSYFPDIIIADEICNNLDEESIYYCFEQIDKLCKENNTLVIISSHNNQEIMKKNPMVITIKNGVLEGGKI